MLAYGIDRQSSLGPLDDVTCRLTVVLPLVLYVSHRMMREVQDRQHRIAVVFGGVSLCFGNVFTLSLDGLPRLKVRYFMRQSFVVAETHRDEHLRADEVLRTAFKLHYRVDPDDELLMIRAVVVLGTGKHLADRTLHASKRCAD
jgi:hypothetical protein